MSPTQRRPEPPSEKTLTWVCEAVGAGARVLEARHLPGGIATRVDAIDVVDADGTLRELVLRRFGQDSNPDYLRHEAAVLELVQDSGVPVPELVALDADGAESGTPSQLTTRLPGAVVITPREIGTWARRLAEPLPAFHALDPKSASIEIRRLRSRSEPWDGKIPEWSKQSEAWRDVLTAGSGPMPPSKPVFTHRDYHPTNVLWLSERISGVVDWSRAAVGPIGADLGHCRVNLVCLHGVEVADLFLDAFEQQVGTRLENQSWFDALTIWSYPWVYPPWLELGMPGLQSADVARRLDAYAVALATRL